MKACLRQSFYLNDRIFDIKDTTVNRDNAAYSYYLPREEFKKHDVILSTKDIHHPQDSDVVLYNDLPRVLPTAEDPHKSYLLLMECEVVSPRSWNREHHKRFNRVFTWHDELFDNQKYIKINFAHLFIDGILPKVDEKKRLCTLISANKHMAHGLELYSKRVEAIRWFEQNHSDDFDLYGIGWDQYRFSGPKIIRALNRIQPLTKMFAPRYPSYKGKVASKLETLSKYRFAICYEKARDIPAYMIEKLFDIFSAGCIPVYWGANNIDQHIPESCYIDKRAFSTYETIYEYMTGLTESEYVE